MTMKILGNLACRLFSLGLLLSAFDVDANAHPQSMAERVERIFVGSCIHQDRDQSVWKSILQKHPQVCLLIGDNIYADTEDPSLIRRKYRQLKAQPDFQKLLEGCRLLATWDDHDYGLNDAGRELSIKKESKEAFLEFLQAPDDSPRRKREGVYDAQILGSGEETVQVLLLDTRSFRSPLVRVANRMDKLGYDYLPVTDSQATMLGEEQWKWLEEELRKPARLRLLISSIQVVSETGAKEKWANFPKERERLFRLIKSTGAKGVVILSGDTHFAELSVLPGVLDYPLFDLTTSGLNMGEESWSNPPLNVHRVSIMKVGSNFGMLEIDWKAKNPRLGFFIYDSKGELFFRQYFPLESLEAIS